VAFHDLKLKKIILKKKKKKGSNERERERERERRGVLDC
jgi:hypothetical protein